VGCVDVPAGWNLVGFDPTGAASTCGNGFGPPSDYYANPNGNLSLAESYMRKAGYPSGKYTGPPLSAVGDNASPAKQTAEAFVQQVKAIGFDRRMPEIDFDTLDSPATHTLPVGVEGAAVHEELVGARREEVGLEVGLAAVGVGEHVEVQEVAAAEMGDAGAKLVEERFTWRAVAAQMEHAYSREALQRRAS